MGWFLYDRNLCHKSVKSYAFPVVIKISSANERQKFSASDVTGTFKYVPLLARRQTLQIISEGICIRRFA